MSFKTVCFIFQYNFSGLQFFSITCIKSWHFSLLIIFVQYTRVGESCRLGSQVYASSFEWTSNDEADARLPSMQDFPTIVYTSPYFV